MSGNVILLSVLPSSIKALLSPVVGSIGSLSERLPRIPGDVDRWWGESNASFNLNFSFNFFLSKENFRIFRDADRLGNKPFLGIYFKIFVSHNFSAAQAIYSNAAAS